MESECVQKGIYRKSRKQDKLVANLQVDGITTEILKCGGETMVERMSDT